MFEQSLRTRLYPVTPAQNGHNPGLNPEFHRGCTGKAHACGTLKSRLNSLKNGNKNTTSHVVAKHGVGIVGSRVMKKLVQRKNSISSETISDSGSENSAPLWLDTTDAATASSSTTASSAVVVVASIDGKTPEANRHDQQRLLQLRKHNLLKNMPTIVGSSGKMVHNSSSSSSKLLHARSIVARNLATSTPNTNTNNNIRRRRLHSEGETEVDRVSETGASNASSTITTTTNTSTPSPSGTFERIHRHRSFRVGNNNNNSYANVNGKQRPPWNSGSSTKIVVNTPVSISSSATTFNARNYRHSFRRRNTVDWPTIWERSFTLRGYGTNSGLYKNYNETIKQKVGKLNKLLFILHLMTN